MWVCFSRARMPLKLNPRKKGFTRIPPELADTTSRSACHALRRRTNGGRSKGLTPTTKYTKKKPQKTMTQKPILWAEGECACVAQIACTEIRGRGRPSASQRERYFWVVSTLEMYTRRRLTCGTRSSTTAEVKTAFQRTGRLVLCLRANAHQRQELLPQPSE